MFKAEEQGFSDFHLYVCAAFLVKWSEQLVKMDFGVRTYQPLNFYTLFTFRCRKL